MRINVSGEKMSLMKQLEKNNKIIKECETALQGIKNLEKELSSSVESLKKANDSIKQYFVINGQSADNGKTSEIISEINGITRILRMFTIPSLNDKIRITKDANYNISRRLKTLER